MLDLQQQPRRARLRPRAGVRAAAILGLGHALPERVVDNAEIAARLGVDAAWIERRTGIRERRHAGPDQSLNDLAVEAGAAALADAGVAPEDVDLVLVATITADRLCPNAAPEVAYRLGTGGAAAMDVGAACTGFLAALTLAAGQIESRRAERVLVIGAEKLSRYLDLDDRRTAGLFADGAGAALVGPGDDAAVGPAVLRSHGELAEAITADHSDMKLRMEGHDTFVAAVAAFTDASRTACALADVDLRSIDLLVLHQANGRITSAVADRLDVPEGRVMDCIGTTGNTSAASIPLALSLARESGRLRAGDTVLLAAVGAGFTSGAAVMTWGLA